MTILEPSSRPFWKSRRFKLNLRRAEYLIRQKSRRFAAPKPRLIIKMIYGAAAYSSWYGKKIFAIRLAAWAVGLCQWVDLRDTLLHELAHILTWLWFGTRAKPHGREWQEICRILGTTPQVFISSSEEKALKQARRLGLRQKKVK